MNQERKFGTNIKKVSFSSDTDILYNIIQQNNDLLFRLINEANVNNIINNKNGYTALHYAIQMDNKELIEYLLNIGASIELYSNINENAIDLSLKYKSKHAINYQINELKNTNKELNKKISVLDKNINDINIDRKFLSETINDLMSKNTSLKKNNDNYLINNKSLKRKYDEFELKYNNLDDKYNNLNNKYNNIKEDYEELDKSYIGLLNTIRKNK